MTDSSTTNTKPNSLYNLQPSSRNTKRRILPSVPYVTENLNIIDKLNCQFYDLTDTEYVTLCNLLIKQKNCYATNKVDVGKTSNLFRIRFKPNAQLMSKRPSKVPIHFRDKVSAHLKKNLKTVLLNKLALLHMINLHMVLTISAHVLYPRDTL